jgi:hypothetical protein
MGIPVAAFPFALIAISSLMGRDFFTGLRFVELAHWGVPETIARLAREQDAAVAATALDQTAGEGESA